MKPAIASPFAGSTCTGIAGLPSDLGGSDQLAHLLDLARVEPATERRVVDEIAWKQLALLEPAPSARLRCRRCRVHRG